MDWAARAGTDTILQQELLTRRFGFQSSGVILLQDDQASRENIS